MKTFYIYFVRVLRFTVFILLISIQQGCYHYRITTPHFDPSTEYHKKTMHSYFWGLVNKPATLITENCTGDKHIDEVVVNTNFGYALITVVTLGIWSPVQIEWKCSKPCPQNGEI